MRKDAMMEDMSSLHKNDTWELSELSRKRRRAVVSGYLERNIDLQIVTLYAKKPDW